MKKQLKRKCIVYGLGIIVYAGAVWGAARFMLSDQEKFAIFLGIYLLTGYGAFQKLSEEIMEKRFPVEYIFSYLCNNRSIWHREIYGSCDCYAYV